MHTAYSKRQEERAAFTKGLSRIGNKQWTIFLILLHILYSRHPGTPYFRMESSAYYIHTYPRSPQYPFKDSCIRLRGEQKKEEKKKGMKHTAPCPKQITKSPQNHAAQTASSGYGGISCGAYRPHRPPSTNSIQQTQTRLESQQFMRGPPSNFYTVHSMLSKIIIGKSLPPLNIIK